MTIGLEQRIRDILGEQCYFDKSLCVNVNSGPNCMGQNCNHCTASKIYTIIHQYICEENPHQCKVRWKHNKRVDDRPFGRVTLMH